MQVVSRDSWTELLRDNLQPGDLFTARIADQEVVGLVFQLGSDPALCVILSGCLPGDHRSPPFVMSKSALSIKTLRFDGDAEIRRHVIVDDAGGYPIPVTRANIQNGDVVLRGGSSWLYVVDTEYGFTKKMMINFATGQEEQVSGGAVHRRWEIVIDEGHPEMTPLLRH